MAVALSASKKEWKSFCGTTVGPVTSTPLRSLHGIKVAHWIPVTPLIKYILKKNINAEPPDGLENFPSGGFLLFNFLVSKYQSTI